LQGKIESGANLIQLFDSWAGILPPPLFRTFALPYIQQIASAIQAVPVTVPVTVFAKGAWFALEDLESIDCNVIGLDWCTSPTYARQYVNKVLQGNLDPCQLYGDKGSVKKAALEMLDSFGGKHIANLGHGVYPDTPLDNVKVFVDTIKSAVYQPV